MNLYIDTTEFNKVTFVLQSGEKTRKKAYLFLPHENDKILNKLEEFLKKSEIRNPKSEIKKIIINKGPGSFVGIRIGAAIVQALGFAWNVPITFLPKEKFKM